MDTSKRNSSIEILRIIAMFMVVLSHFMVHTNWELKKDVPAFNLYLIDALALGNFGNVIYVLISSYFIIGATFKLSRILKVWGGVVFYSLVVYFAFLVFGVCGFTAIGFIRSLFPIVFNQYWFASTYIIFYFLTPYLNLLLQNLGEKQHKAFLIGGFIVWSAITTVVGLGMQYSSLVWFVYLFFVAGYMKKYEEKIKLRARMYICLGICCIVLYFLSVAFISFIGDYIVFFSDKKTMLNGFSSPIVFAAGVFLFMGAIKAKPFKNRTINRISVCTFGVYLISEQPQMREYLWNQLLPSQSYLASPLFILYVISAVVLVYAACTLIEFLRINTIEKTYGALLRKLDGLVPRDNQ